MKTLITFALSAGVVYIATVDRVAAGTRQDSPNVIFFMAEDLSRDCFEIYHGYGANTPVLRTLAEHGVKFENAYSCSPVSSAARSSLITGCYAPSYGMSSHRKLEPVHLPDSIRLFPYYLKEAGYFTANASKTDYNCTFGDGVWDKVKGKIGDWRLRKSIDQPFFFCFTMGACHESCLHFPGSDVDSIGTDYDPADVHLYPYHPDTDLFRYTYARLYDKIGYVDNVLGRMISMLEDDGLLDDTFIFFMGDNGGSVPFSKGYTNEPGVCIPLVVYVPDNWKSMVPYEYGDSVSSFVSFLDLAPTVLSIAGIHVPEYMDGMAFFGDNVCKDDIESRDVVFCYGDRYDELYAVNRTVRKGNMKYSRNYLPYQPKGMYCHYRYLQAFFREWRDMYEHGALNEAQSSFFRPQGAEELYDLSEDPYETNNLVADPVYFADLVNMRNILNSKIIESKDLVLVPEAFWIEYTDDIEKYRNTLSDCLPKYLSVADLQTKSFVDIKDSLLIAIASPDPVVRYWGVTVCCGAGEEAISLQENIVPLLYDSSSVICSRAALFLVKNGLDVPDNIFRHILSKAENSASTLMILNDIAFLYEYVPDFEASISADDLKFKPTGYEDRLAFYANFKTT